MYALPTTRLGGSAIYIGQRNIKVDTMLLYALWFLASMHYFGAEPHMQAIPVEECQFHGACTGTGWVLEYQGNLIQGLPDDMTEEQCRDILSQLEPQTAPFTQMECVQVGVSRQGT